LKKKNQRRETPIRFLAEHIAAFNAKRETKQELAQARALLADRIYGVSVPVRERI
jgi:hypothetical protein